MKFEKLLEDPIIQQLMAVVAMVTDRGVVVTPVAEGLLFRLAPAGEQVPEDGWPCEDVSDHALESGALRKSW